MLKKTLSAYQTKELHVCKVNPLFYTDILYMNGSSFTLEAWLSVLNFGGKRLRQTNNKGNLSSVIQSVYQLR